MLIVVEIAGKENKIWNLKRLSIVPNEIEVYLLIIVCMCYWIKSKSDKFQKCPLGIPEVSPISTFTRNVIFDSTVRIRLVYITHAIKL